MTTDNSIQKGMTPGLKFAVGSNDFRRVVAESDVFVDKSLFIKEVIEASDEAILITRPRRWGKTLNMRMLECFFAPEIDENGVIQEHNSNKKLFGNLKIAKETTYVRDESSEQKLVNILDLQGQYPTIFISFKDAKGKDESIIKSKITGVISDVFQEHEYLYKAISLKSEISEGDRKNLSQFKRILNKEPGEGELETSVKFLSDLLCKHFNKKVYILVDEYDAAFNFLLEESIDNRKLDNLRREVALLMTSMLSSCGKDNDSVKKIILTGIFDTLKKEGASGFNNISVYGILDADFSTSFGFSEQEIKEQLLSKFNLDEKLTYEISNNIKNWYNGYSVPLYNRQTYKGDNMHVYTPWAVMQYINGFSKGKIEPESYWSRSGSSTILENLLQSGVEKELENKFSAFAQGEKQVLEIDKGISLIREDIDSYREIEKVFAYLLVNAGYLTGVQNENKRYIFQIPNFEVRKEFIDCIERQLYQYKAFKISDPFIESLIKADKERIKVVFTRYVFETFSSLDVPKTSGNDKTFTAERSYHMFVLGLLHRIVKTHIIKSETETGLGRADIIMLPREIDKSINKSAAEGSGFIIELKRMTAEDRTRKVTLEALAKEGLEQIKARKYRTILEQHEVKNKVFISVAFYGKEVAILIEEELTKSFNPEVEWEYAQGKMSRVLW